MSEYSIDLRRSWGEVVAASVAAAKSGIGAVEGRDIWVQLTWVSRAEVDSARKTSD